MRNLTKIGIGMAVLTLAVSVPLAAHHAFATYYLEEDSIEIEGNIVEFQYKNPHAWVFVEGREGFGQLRIWAAEWVGTSRLEREGITRNTLREGDVVRIWAAPNRNPADNRIHLKRIRRSDGWQWGSNARETR